MTPLPIWTPTAEDLAKEQHWISQEIGKIGKEKLEELAKRASKIRNSAYAPYSKFYVGVAILTASGDIYNGINAERVGYSETDHAEESAITNAIVHGEIQKSGRRFITAMAVSLTSDAYSCGRCRQITVEHCDNAIIILCDTDGNIRNVTSIKTLLPYAFTPSDLGIV